MHKVNSTNAPSYFLHSRNVTSHSKKKELFRLPKRKNEIAKKGTLATKERNNGTSYLNILDRRNTIRYAKTS